MDHGDVAARAPEFEWEARTNANRPDRAEAPSACHLDALPRLARRREPGVCGQHAADDPGLVTLAQELDHPFHAAGRRRIELADVQDVELLVILIPLHVGQLQGLRYTRETTDVATSR